MNKKEKKLYSIFDGDDRRYKLKETSMRNVAEVCRVQAQRIALNDASRAKYADQAGLEPIGFEKKDGQSSPIFELDDIYSEHHISAALAQVLFYDCPEMIEAQHREQTVYRQGDKILFKNPAQDGFKKETETVPEVTIIDQDKFEALQEGAVQDAFLAFSAARRGTQGAQPNSQNISEILQGLSRLAPKS